MAIPEGYSERVYAGVLGKIIGVYLGRPFEGWTHERIEAELGEIQYFVHEKLGKPLIVTDDDISGTFTFLRALPDYGNKRDITPAQIGQTWLNYLIEERTVLWWGGLGNSTEHTAYLNLKKGIQAPESGSMARNSRIVAEQIGAQIFIDGWAMVCPGDPELAADIAHRAASVSHDGEAIYAAQVLAAMEAQAFVEADLQKLLDVGISFIPTDSVIYRLINELREKHIKETDWRKARSWVDREYGYHKYGGNVHVIPNHALILLSLLYGDDDFQKTLMIVNTCGWDTDCNSGNVGCLLGIKNGLEGINAGPDWRGPIADRLYLPTADGGRAITDAVQEAVRIVNIGRALEGKTPIKPKDGARFHFEFPGSVQGFHVEDSSESAGVCTLENVPDRSRTGQRSLAIHFRHLAPGRCARVATATFIPPEMVSLEGSYDLLASPTLFSGQIVRAKLSADEGNLIPVNCYLYFRTYSVGDQLKRSYSPVVPLEPASDKKLKWMIPDTGGEPIAEIGVELSASKVTSGTVYLDYLTWDGVPNTVFSRPLDGGRLWRRAWIHGVDQCDSLEGESFRIIQNEGTGLLIQGSRSWQDYEVSADVTPHFVRASGIAARVQGMQRYYALLLSRPRKLKLIKALDGEKTLAESKFNWQFGETYQLTLTVIGTRIIAHVNQEQVFDLEDDDVPLLEGGIALVCTEGRTATNQISICPA
jgi:ADP-ribosylglycohydrolase